MTTDTTSTTQEKQDLSNTLSRIELQRIAGG